MLRYNSAMSNMLSTFEWGGGLSEELSAIAAKGFYKCEGCALLEFFRSVNTNVVIGDLVDKTGYECFVNSIHVDDYVEDHWFVGAMLFASQLLDSWSASSNEEILQVIVSSNEFGSVVKAHVLRAGESWVSEDLEGYEEAILLVTSDLGRLQTLVGSFVVE